jgi:hypothetical protein
MCHDEGTLAKYIKIHGYSHDTWMCLKIEHPIFKWPALKNEKKITHSNSHSMWHFGIPL